MRIEPEVTVHNVVASAKFKHSIDLNSIVKAFPNVEYRPEKFPGLAFKLEKPKSCCLIFNNGKMVCTGTKSARQARTAVLKVSRELKKNGIVILGKPELEIQNIVASVELGNVVVDLEEFIYAAQDYGKRVMYEPDQFPGAIYRMEDPKVVFLVFSTGKLVCVGARREEEIYRAVKNLLTVLEETDVIMIEEKTDGIG